MISLIVAKAANGAIGKGNRMPWHISGDLKYFKRVTTGRTAQHRGKPLAYCRS